MRVILALEGGRTHPIKRDRHAPELIVVSAAVQPLAIGPLATHNQG
jgi:hypothetical protein